MHTVDVRHTLVAPQDVGADPAFPQRDVDVAALAAKLVPAALGLGRASLGIVVTGVREHTSQSIARELTERLLEALPKQPYALVVTACELRRTTVCASVAQLGAYDRDVETWVYRVGGNIVQPVTTTAGRLEGRGASDYVTIIDEEPTFNADQLRYLKARATPWTPLLQLGPQGQLRRLT